MVNRKRLNRHATWTALALMAPCAWAADDLLLHAPALDAEQLEASNGRQGLPLQWQVNDTEQNATVTDNVLQGNVVTGDNSISDHAFDNMSGVATVIQNTGNQVVIQDSTQINVLINQ